MAAAETITEKDTRRECAHGDVWLAADGQWYCVICSPPYFDGEVRERRQLEEVLRLFDDDGAA